MTPGRAVRPGPEHLRERAVDAARPRAALAVERAIPALPIRAPTDRPRRSTVQAGGVSPTVDG